MFVNSILNSILVFLLMGDNYCAPSRDNINKQTGSCFTGHELQKIAQTYNQENTDKIDERQSPQQLHQMVKQKLATPNCNKDYCFTI